MTDIEEQNRYNAKAYDGFGENEDILFLPEIEAFEEWLDTAETRKGKRHAAKSKHKIIKDVKRYFAAMETLSEENVRLYKNGMRDADMAVSYINSGIKKPIDKFIKDREAQAVKVFANVIMGRFQEVCPMDASQKITLFDAIGIVLDALKEYEK